MFIHVFFLSRVEWVKQGFYLGCNPIFDLGRVYFISLCLNFPICTLSSLPKNFHMRIKCVQLYRQLIIVPDTDYIISMCSPLLLVLMLIRILWQIFDNSGIQKTPLKKEGEKAYKFQADMLSSRIPGLHYQLSQIFHRTYHLKYSWDNLTK